MDWRNKGSPQAARTDDILTIFQMQFEKMDPGPKLIAADLNGPTDAFPTINAMIKEQGWTDIGMDNTKCDGEPGQPTCQTNEVSVKPGSMISLLTIG